MTKTQIFRSFYTLSSYEGETYRRGDGEDRSAISIHSPRMGETDDIYFEVGADKFLYTPLV